MDDPRCKRCNEPLDVPGALLFSPPRGRAIEDVSKFHLCEKCYQAVCEFLVSAWSWLPCNCPDKCCKIHDAHSMPHKGCMFR